LSQKNRKSRRAKLREGSARTDTRRDTSGRLHLVVRRDPASGRGGVFLEAPVFAAAWQNEITAGAANTTYAVLERELTVDRVADLAKSLMGAMSRLAEGLLARAPEGTVACRAGCDHCCYQVVGVTPPEALAIARELRSTLSAEALARVSARLHEATERARGLDAAERFSPDHPCVFLESGRCTIYAVRPLACRGMNSLDATECSSRLRDPLVRAEFLATGTGGHSYLEPIRAFHAISAGLQLALAELVHLDMRPLELTPALHLLLAAPETLGAEWLRGESPFESVLAADHTGDRRMREVSGRV
jgi:Fe-S-cluster containining protein